MIDRILRRLSVRARVLGAVATLLVLLAVTLAVTAINLSSLGDQLELATNVNARAERLLLRSQVLIISSRVNLLRYMSDAVPGVSDALADVSDASLLLEEAGELFKSSGQAIEIEGVLRGLENYSRTIGEVQRARLENRQSDLTVELYNANSSASSLGQQIDLIVNQSEGIITASSNAALENSSRSLVILLTGFTALMLLVLVGSFFMQRSITNPINDLRVGAEAFRTGQLETVIPVTGHDELGVLAQAFNQMAAQLASSYRDLEQRVEERTQDLQQRALQVQVAAEVARDAAAAQNLDTLLNQSVNLIRDRFGLYSVSVFLVDDLGENAIMRSGTGESSRVLMERGYKMRVGEVGLVGYVTGSGMVRIVNDVDADFVYVRDPLLPNTRSEMVVPLRSGGKTIGALDVQSDKLNAFGQDDVTVMQIMADQLTIGIQNVRLVEELQQRLSEINTLFQRYTQDSWARAATTGMRSMGYEYDLAAVRPLEGQGVLAASEDIGTSKDLLDRLEKGRSTIVQAMHHPARQEAQIPPTALVAPLMMYDNLIGVLGIESDNPEHAWSEDEVALIESVASQVALALDNARLIEESQLRTDQLRLLQDITAAAVSHVRLGDLLEDVSQKVRAGFDLLHCGIALLDPGGKAMTLVANASTQSPDGKELLGGGIVGTKIPLEGNELTQSVIHSRHAKVVYDAQHDPITALTHEIHKLRGTNTLVVVPLVARDQVIGTIGMDVADQQRRFSEDDLRLMEQISLQIATAIEVARNFEVAESRAGRERMVGEMTSHMRERLDVESVLQTAVNEFYANLGLEETVVYLAPPDVSDQAPVAGSLPLDGPGEAPALGGALDALPDQSPKTPRKRSAASRKRPDSGPSLDSDTPTDAQEAANE